MERQCDREEIYNGKVINVVRDEVELDDGTKSMREVVLHNGGACIAARDGDHYYMVRQYRYAQGMDMLEFPAGKIERGEDHRQTILREVQEETGYSVRELRYFGYIVPTGGYCSERIHLYYGLVDELVGQHFDRDERIELEKYTLKQIKQMIREGKICDGKTVALVYHIETEGLDA